MEIATLINEFGELSFTTLPMFGLVSLPLPTSNVDVERILSKFNHIKPKMKRKDSPNIASYFCVWNNTEHRRMCEYQTQCRLDKYVKNHNANLYCNKSNM